MTNRCAWLLGVAVSLASETSGALAQVETDHATRNEARQLGQQGIEAFWAEQFADAEAKLDRAFTLFPTPTLGLWSARARQKLGRWVDAVARYQETLERSSEVGNNAAQQGAQLEAKTELDQFMPRVPSIVLSVAGEDLETVVVRVDGRPVPAEALGTRLLVDPGTHTLEASRGDEHHEQRVELSEAQHLLAAFSFSPLRPPAPPLAVAQLPPLAAAAAPPPAQQSPFVPISIAALATGTASIVASGVLAFVATNKRADDCPRSECTTAEAKDAYEALKTASTVTFYAGAALAVGGLAGWLFLGPVRASDERAVAWDISPGGISVTTKF